MYDIIGDIHGYASHLKALLTRLSYANVNGVWQHPQRKAIFLGDFVDRGPEQVQTVQIVRDMVTQGHALAVMGNHELNAIAWFTPRAQQEVGSEEGVFLREHSEKNYKQHKQFLDQVGQNADLHVELIDWFKTLPLYLEFDKFRLVHACWNTHSIECLKPFLDDSACVKPDAWQEILRKGTKAFEACEIILKGMEIPLPTGINFKDEGGHARSHIRTQWWKDKTETLTYRDLALVPPHVLDTIPHEPIPADLMIGYDGEKVLFVGHYWLTGQPQPLSAHIACLDYSIAAQSDHSQHHKGKLCAYRYEGEKILTSDSFVWVS